MFRLTIEINLVLVPHVHSARATGHGGRILRRRWGVWTKSSGSWQKTRASGWLDGMAVAGPSLGLGWVGRLGGIMLLLKIYCPSINRPALVVLAAKRLSRSTVRPVSRS